MSFARGKYGVEHNRRPADEETHGLRRIVVPLAILSAVVSVAIHFFTGRTDGPAEESAPPSPPSIIPATPPGGRPSSPAPENTVREDARPSASGRSDADTPKPDAVATHNAEKMLDRIRQRPAAERVLLEKLAAAERQGHIAIAIDTIERLCSRPAVADLHPQLRERLGSLNVKRLHSDRTTEWTATVTVKRGDSRERIARDHGTTGAALEMLNPGVDWARIHPGDAVRVLEHPRAVLVVHKGLGIADLSLKGKFFKRYYFKGGADAAIGVHPVTREPGASVRGRLKELGLTFSLEDREALQAFLAPDSSSITVSEQ